MFYLCCPLGYLETNEFITLSECCLEGYGDFATEDNRASAKFWWKSSIQLRGDFCWKLEQELLDLRQVASIPKRISW